MLQALQFTHLIHTTRGVYGAHLAKFRILINDWSCRLQVGLDSASKGKHASLLGSDDTRDSEETEIRSKTHMQVSNSQLNGSDRSILIRSACCYRQTQISIWNQWMVKRKHTCRNNNNYSAFYNLGFNTVKVQGFLFWLKDWTFSPNFLCCHLCVHCSFPFLDIFGCKPVGKRDRELMLSVKWLAGYLFSSVCVIKQHSLLFPWCTSLLQSKKSTNLTSALSSMTVFQPWRLSSLRGKPSMRKRNFFSSFCMVSSMAFENRNNNNLKYFTHWNRCLFKWRIRIWFHTELHSDT